MSRYIFQILLYSILGFLAIELSKSPQFMISRTTENVASTDELTEAFRSLTEDGNKPYITASELYAAMPPDQVIEFKSGDNLSLFVVVIPGIPKFSVIKGDPYLNVLFLCGFLSPYSVTRLNTYY